MERKRCYNNRSNTKWGYRRMTVIKGNIAECILNIAEAQFQDVNVVDKEINFMSLIIRLIRIIK